MPLLHILELILVFFLLFAWIWVVIRIIADVILSKDLGGLAKGLWMLLIILIPWLGVLCYLIVRGRGIENRNYTQRVAVSSVADELTKLAELRDKGVLTDAEFDAQKDKLLS